MTCLSHAKIGGSHPHWPVKAVCALLLLSPVGAGAQTTPQAQETAAAAAPLTILDLQPFRQSQTVAIEGEGGRRGTATLLALNPRINSWFVLTLDREGAAAPEAYHLENPAPATRRLRLDAAHPSGIVIEEGGKAQRCDLWSADGDGALERARRSRASYAPLCDGRLLLRNKSTGRRTRLEQITDVLRDRVWGGEQIVGFVRESLFRDAFIEHGAPAGPTDCTADSAAPERAAMDPDAAERAVTPDTLGVSVTAPTPALTLGCWYPVTGQPGIYLSAIEPGAVAQEIRDSYRKIVGRMDSVEASALVYLVAFDLEKFDLGFELGTDHPRLGWSERPPESAVDERLPGPDGIGDAAPLVTTGRVSPELAGRTAATFIGGFKRGHGAFRYGELAKKNHGSHYGFLSHGTLFSTLQPGLATLYVLDDGTVDIKTWSEADAELLDRIRHARQNGVPLVQRDPDTGVGVPGALVSRWGRGNWSGSAEGKLRTLRAGACIQEGKERRFLIYGWFSSATPAAMVRVFQAYGCRDAMLLDMNALEHSYLALYSIDGDRVTVQHLVDGMTEVDARSGKTLIPRFIGFSDNRDFFYVVRRETEK